MPPQPICLLGDDPRDPVQYTRIPSHSKWLWALAAAAALRESQRTPNSFSRDMYLKWADWYATRRPQFLSLKGMGIVTRWFISRCAVCGKTAQYKRGLEGRCKQHQSILPESTQRNRRRMEAGSNQFYQDRRAADYLALNNRVDSRKVHVFPRGFVE